MAKESATRTEEVFDGIRRDLLNGQLVPGQRLKTAALAGHFGVSLSVVREALTRLAEQGLVVASPQRGFRVKSLSIDDLSDLTQTRIQVESLALRQSIAKGRVDWEAAVVSACHTLDRTPVNAEDGQFNEDWPAVHRAFHQALISGCGSPRLEAIVTSLRDSAELYRRWYWALTEDQVRNLTEEHRQLRDLALDRDADTAVDALTEHIGRAPRKLIAYAREHNLEDPTSHPSEA
ncbi:GntR family transcriptional regulator [Streptomyces sp. NPDC091292]|uniref:GntR family transcriptional regulator n=1 Tax=Streptomyces sp. NPDC091292 TaxID=3365991 RepID=UPI00382F9109